MLATVDDGKMANYGGRFPSVYKGTLILPRPPPELRAPPPLFSFHGSSSPPSSSSSSSAIGRSEALKVHSEAEKRRRERINAHLSTLRHMVPDASKMDKASLLGSVIEHVKDLKRKFIQTSDGFTIPSDVNKVTIEEGNDNSTESNEDKTFYIKASICCDDRPDLFISLIHTFHALRLTTVRADITSLGGRIQNEFILCGKDGDGSMCLSSVKAAVKEALGRVASFEEASSDSSPFKRQRILQSHYSNLSL